MKEQFLKPEIKINDHLYYGLGVYIYEEAGKKIYYAVGCDFGTNFFTAYFPKSSLTFSALGNTEVSLFPLMRKLFTSLE